MADVWARRQRSAVAWEHGLDDPSAVLRHLRDMQAAGSRAHEAASEDDGLTGPVRDLIFGINTMIDALVNLIGEPE